MLIQGGLRHSHKLRTRPLSAHPVAGVKTGHRTASFSYPSRCLVVASSLSDAKAWVQRTFGKTSNTLRDLLQQVIEDSSRQSTYETVSHVRIAEDLLVLRDTKRHRHIYVINIGSNELNEQQHKLSQLLHLTRAKRVWFVSQKPNELRKLAWRVRRHHNIGCWDVMAGPERFTPEQQIVLDAGYELKPLDMVALTRARQSSVDPPDNVYTCPSSRRERSRPYMSRLRQRALRASRIHAAPSHHHHHHAPSPSLMRLAARFRNAVQTFLVADGVAAIRNRDLDAIKRSMRQRDARYGRLSRLYGFELAPRMADTDDEEGLGVGADPEQAGGGEEEEGYFEEEDQGAAAALASEAWHDETQPYNAAEQLRAHRRLLQSSLDGSSSEGDGEDFPPFMARARSLPRRPRGVGVQGVRLPEGGAQPSTSDLNASQQQQQQGPGSQEDSGGSGGESSLPLQGDPSRAHSQQQFSGEEGSRADVSHDYLSQVRGSFTGPPQGGAGAVGRSSWGRGGGKGPPAEPMGLQQQGLEAAGSAGSAGSEDSEGSESSAGTAGSESSAASAGSAGSAGNAGSESSAASAGSAGSAGNAGNAGSESSAGSAGPGAPQDLRQDGESDGSHLFAWPLEQIDADTLAELDRMQGGPHNCEISLGSSPSDFTLRFNVHLDGAPPAPPPPKGAKGGARPRKRKGEGEEGQGSTGHDRQHLERCYACEEAQQQNLNQLEGAWGQQKPAAPPDSPNISSTLPQQPQGRQEQQPQQPLPQAGAQAPLPHPAHTHPGTRHTHKGANSSSGGHPASPHPSPHTPTHAPPHRHTHSPSHRLGSPPHAPYYTSRAHTPLAAEARKQPPHTAGTATSSAGNGSGSSGGGGAGTSTPAGPGPGAPHTPAEVQQLARELLGVDVPEAEALVLSQALRDAAEGFEGDGAAVAGVAAAGEEAVGAAATEDDDTSKGQVRHNILEHGSPGVVDPKAGGGHPQRPPPSFPPPPPAAAAADGAPSGGSSPEAAHGGAQGGERYEDVRAQQMREVRDTMEARARLAARRRRAPARKIQQLVGGWGGPRAPLPHALHTAAQHAQRASSMLDGDDLERQQPQRPRVPGMEPGRGVVGEAEVAAWRSQAVRCVACLMEVLHAPATEDSGAPGEDLVVVVAQPRLHTHPATSPPPPPQHALHGQGGGRGRKGGGGAGEGPGGAVLSQGGWVRLEDMAPEHRDLMGVLVSEVNESLGGQEGEEREEVEGGEEAEEAEEAEEEGEAEDAEEGGEAEAAEEGEEDAKLMEQGVKSLQQLVMEDEEVRQWLSLGVGVDEDHPGGGEGGVDGTGGVGGGEGEDLLTRIGGAWCRWEQQLVAPGVRAVGVSGRRFVSVDV